MNLLTFFISFLLTVVVKTQTNCVMINNHIIEWSLNTTHITMKVSTVAGANSGWAGIGFNGAPAMDGASIIVGYKGNNIYEYTASGHSINLNTKQRITSISTSTINGRLVQQFVRPLRGKKIFLKS
jgi:hypothetical protein